MAATQRIKSSDLSPLSNDGILQQTLAFTRDAYLYLALNTQWRAVYRRTRPRLLTYLSNAFSSTAALEVAVEAGLKLNKKKVSRAAGRYASIEVLEAAHELGLKWSCHVAAGAATDVAKLEWLYCGQSCPVIMQDLKLSAVRTDDVAVAQWLLDLGESFTADHIAKAALACSMRVLNLLYDNGFKPNGDAVKAAGAAATTEPLRWLFSKGCPHYYKADYAAAKNAPLEVLQFLQANLEQQWTAQELRFLLLLAGEGGRLENCKWLRQQGAAWPQHLEGWPDDCVEWAREEGCDAPLVAPLPELHDIDSGSGNGQSSASTDAFQCSAVQARLTQCVSELRVVAQSFTIAASGVVLGAAVWRAVSVR
eukprot:15703-Heterococcus_DN1.PRE.3